MKMFLQIILQCVLLMIGYVVIKYRYVNKNTGLLKLSKKKKKYLIKNFKPDPIVPVKLIEFSIDDKKSEGRKNINFSAKDDNINSIISENENNNVNFASFDIFCIANSSKRQIKKYMRKHWIGSCGPRGFYGTFPIHIETEHKIANIFKKDDAILYSNYYTAIQSVIACFCQNTVTVYYHKNSTHAIKEELNKNTYKKAVFETVEELDRMLKEDPEDKWLIVEHLAMNTGKIFELDKLVSLRKNHGLRVILDVSLSFPAIMSKSVPEFAEIDGIVGALSFGYAGNGGFSCGSREFVEYQRLNSVAYTFSAALSGFQTAMARCNLEKQFDYGRISKLRELAGKHIRNVVSDSRSPILLVESKNAKKIHENLKREGFFTGITGEYLRITININHTEDIFKKLGELINKLESEIVV